MYLVSQLILSSYLCYTDLRYRRIPNISLLIFLTTSTVLGIFNLKASLLILALLLIFRRISRQKIGMGDVKLISVLALGVPSFSVVLLSLWIASVLALVGAVVHRIHNGFWSTSIAFAPYICLGFLLSR